MTETTFGRVYIADDWGYYARAEQRFRSFEKTGDRYRRPEFCACFVDDACLAVVVHADDVSEDERREMAANLPDWIGSIIFVERVEKADDRRAVITLDHGVAEPLERAAAAAACATFSSGLFDFEPETYQVQIPGKLQVEVSLAFDWDTETYSARARRTSRG